MTLSLINAYKCSLNIKIFDNLLLISYVTDTEINLTTQGVGQ